MDDRKERHRKKEKLRSMNELDLDFLSCKDKDHFKGGLTAPSFDCEVRLYQEERSNNITYRFVTGRFADDVLIESEQSGVPEWTEEEINQRLIATYWAIYPEGYE